MISRDKKNMNQFDEDNQMSNTFRSLNNMNKPEHKEYTQIIQGLESTTEEYKVSVESIEDDVLLHRR